MLKREALALRELDGRDISGVRRILETSEYIHYRFGADELPGLIGRLPGVGVFSVPTGRLVHGAEPALRAFLVVNWLVPPSAWIGGFGVTWSEGSRFADYLDLLLQPLEERARAQGARMLYYSGNDLDSDWLAPTLDERGFALVSLLRSYDKDDFAIPDEGNMQVRVRPFVPADVAGVVEVERHGFDQLWRHDAANFLEIAATYPYFVVAEDDAGIVGYQFNAVDTTAGYLVRIAVHPRVEGRGVGARLMAEAVRYFHAHKVWKIVLNTEEQNTRAHRLYERFGFHLVTPRGFVLGRAIEV
ncbi:MAG TPA: GNAT family N-acetyltransferase [Ktedonobacterales bacterium]|nr:GNAT family N-acetyltransferase [Ktedonobacterales bacterium]